MAIEVTFHPQMEKVYNLNLPCVVKKKPSAMNLNIKGEGFAVHETLLMEGEEGTTLEVSAMVSTDVDFGQVDINEKRIKNITIVNSGRFPVDFAWTHPHSSVLSISPELDTVKPGARLTVQLQYSPVSEGSLDNYEAICSIANGRQYVLSLRGTGRKPLLNFTSSFVDFGACFLHRPGLEPQTEILKITNDDVTDISFDCDFESKAYLEVHVAPTVLEPGESREIPIIFQPRDIIAYEEKLAFEINGSYTHYVVIKGEGQEPRVELANLTHQNLAFGALRVGQEAFRTVKIINKTRVTAEVKLDRSAGKLASCAITYSPNTSIVLSPKEAREIDIRFQPLQRIRHFSQELYIDVGGVTRQLLVISGTGIGIDIKLESSTLIFGDVVKESSVTKQLMIGNVGDIGTKFSWDASQFAPDFTIFPTEGFIPANDEVKLEITFAPSAFNDDLRLDGLRCNVEGSEPLFLTLVGKCVPAPDTAQELTFQCAVRDPEVQSQNVSISNPTDSAWALRPSISHDAWHGAETLTVPAKGSANYNVAYVPLTMTAEGEPHKGYIFFPLPDGSAVTYALVGTATEPNVLDEIFRELPAKKPHTESLSVTNWLKTTQRFKVTVDSPDDPATFISFNDTLDVSGMQTKDYKMTFNAFKEGDQELRVTFTNEKTREYVFYMVKYTVTAPVVMGVIPLETLVRSPVAHTIAIENPTDDTVTIVSSCDSSAVKVPAELHISPHSDVQCQIHYNPLLADESVEKLGFSCVELGDFPYELKLKALPAGLEQSLHFKTPLGSSQAQTFRFTQYLPKGVDFKCSIDNTADFEIAGTCKAEAAESESGTEASVDVTFSPSMVGETHAMLTVSNPEGGDYRAALYGHCIPPVPQGPFVIASGSSVKVDFQNVFDAPTNYNFSTDNKAFIVKAGESIAPKKTTSIDIAFKPEGDAEGVVNAKLYVACDGMVPWIFYLEGTV